MVALGLQSPAAMPSNADESGVFGEDCLSEASSAAARFFEQRRETEGHDMGCHLLWLLSFGQAKESNLPSGNPDLLLI